MAGSKFSSEARKSARLMLAELEGVARRLDPVAIERAVRIVLASERKGGRLHLVGIGKPASVARFIAGSMSSTGTPAYFLDAAEVVHGGAGQVRPADVVIAISNSGQTPEIRGAVALLKSLRVRIIGVGGGPASWLAKNADLFLEARVDREGDPLNLAPRASVLAEIFVLNVLSVVLQAAKGLTAEQFRRRHPGGTLGKRR